MAPALRMTRSIKEKLKIFCAGSIHAFVNIKVLFVDLFSIIPYILNILQASGCIDSASRSWES